MADIGSTLREARMRARIDISEVEAKTKIRAKYLRAIENEEWDLLPGPIYVKSFLKTYADYLGLDSRLLLDEFKRRFERPTDHELRPIGSIGRERERAARGPLLPSWAIIGVVLVAVVAVLYLIGSGSGSKTPPAPVSAGTGSHAKKRHHGHAHHRVKPPVTTPPAPTVAKLQLVPTGDVYVCVVDSTGKKWIPGVIYTAGQTIPTVSAGELLITLGNNAVQMRVNGKPYTVTASASAIGLKVTSTGVAPLPAAQEPTCQ
jgi:cytoskeleton protein RodZ